ncbi:unnamed protein product [Caretta caretta]
MWREGGMEQKGWAVTLFWKWLVGSLEEFRKAAPRFTQVGKLQHLLPDIQKWLHEADRDVIAKAITDLNLIFTGTDRESTSPAAVQVAEKLLPFFDDVRPGGPWETLQAVDV